MIDLALLMRLQGAVSAAMSSIPTGQSAVAGHAMTEAYMRCRSEVRMGVDASLHAEFDRLFPALQSRPGSVGLDTAAKFNEARAALGRLEGWLGGQIEYLKFERQANLEAEAKAKRQAPGFKPDRVR